MRVLFLLVSSFLLPPHIRKLTAVLDGSGLISRTFISQDVAGFLSYVDAYLLSNNPITWLPASSQSLTVSQPSAARQLVSPGSS